MIYKFAYDSDHEDTGEYQQEAATIRDLPFQLHGRIYHRREQETLVDHIDYGKEKRFGYIQRVAQCGGSTVFLYYDGKIRSVRARCRPTESFCRRSGVLSALQNLLTRIFGWHDEEMRQPFVIISKYSPPQKAGEPYLIKYLTWEHAMVVGLELFWWLDSGGSRALTQEEIQAKIDAGASKRAEKASRRTVPEGTREGTLTS